MELTPSQHACTLALVLAVALCVSCSPAKDLDTEEIARTCTPAVMLVVSEGDNEGEVQGTGFLVSPEGLLVTNHHVVQGGKRLVAKSSTGGIYPVTAVKGDDVEHDVAVLQIDAQNMPFLRLDESPQMIQPGRRIAVIGNPIGLQGTVTEGVVSAVRKLEFGDVLQISAAISPGSSGSPVLNADSKVVGLATFKARDGEALNFAIPAREIAKVLGAAQAVAKSEIKAAPYAPNPLAKGSPEEDAKVLHDPAFASVKALEVKGDYFGMLNESKRLTADYPHSAVAHRLLADAFYYVGLLDDSVIAIRTAIDLDPSNPRGWNDLSVIYTDAGEKAKALGVYTHAIKIAPDDAKLLIDYAHVISESNPDVARAALSHARKLLSESRGVDVESKVYALGADLVAGFARLGDTQQAYESSVEAIRQQPDNWENWDAYASAALAMKKFGEVPPAVNRANKLDKTKAGRRYVILGRSGLESSNAPLAIDAFRWAYTTRPNDPEVLTGLIFALCKKGTMTEQEFRELHFCLRELNRVDPQLGKSMENVVVQFLKQRTGR